MKIKPYVEKLEQSEEYRNFKIKYPNAYMIAGFFVLDFETKINVHQIDFYIPEEKKIAAFTLDDGTKLQMMEMLNKSVPDKMSLDTNIDLDALKGILEDEMHNRGMSEKIKKIIAVIQNVKGKKIWNVNCVLSGMEILKSHVDDESKTILKIEKQNLMDIMKTMPKKQVMQQQKPASAEDAKKQIANLDKLEAEIEKEKARIKAELDKKGPEKSPEEKPKA